jgi:hypothetical protein
MTLRSNGEHVARVLTALLFVIVSIPAAAQSPNCPGADPNDSFPDDPALQWCLDNLPDVILDGNAAGAYIVQVGLRMPSGKTFRSVGSFRAVVKAHPDLLAPILSASGVSNFSIQHLMFHGDVYNRTQRDSYCVAGRTDGKRNGHNVTIEGSSNFTVDDIESRAAMCGSGFGVNGDNFEIMNSWFVFNGRSKFEASEQWADGMTITSCGPNPGTKVHVHNNTFWDNTDVNLVVGNGSGCKIYDNTIQNSGTYAFAGFMAEAFDGGVSNQSGSDYRRNAVSSGLDKMGFGIMIGPHAWHASTSAVDFVSFQDGSATGAVVNLAVDGANNTTVLGNTMSNPQGSQGVGCAVSANYTAAHYTGTIQEPDSALPLHYNAGMGCGQP